MNSAIRVFTARHTRNQDTAINEAQKVLELSTEWADEFTRTAEKLLSIKVPVGSLSVDKVLNTVFVKKKDETDRQRDNREEVNALVRGLYLSEKNAGGYGANGWALYNNGLALYNTIVEYFDHYRDAKPNERAISSMDPNSWVTKKKHETQSAILALI